MADDNLSDASLALRVANVLPSGVLLRVLRLLLHWLLLHRLLSAPSRGCARLCCQLVYLDASQLLFCQRACGAAAGLAHRLLMALSRNG